MTAVTDDYMKQMLAKTKEYYIVLLKPGPRAEDHPDIKKLIWEHGRRNFALRADGVLSIVCPISDGSNVAGVGIFNADVEEVTKIMGEDPAVKAGVLIYEIHPCRSFPGSCIPE